MPTKTWTSTALSSTDMNDYVRDQRLTAICIARSLGTQSLANATITGVLLDNSEDYDPDGIHSTSTNPSRFTPVYSGYYIIAGSVSFNANTGGSQRLVLAIKNGGTATYYGKNGQYAFNGGFANIVPIESVPIFCNGTTDYVEIAARQDIGGALVLGGAVISCYRLRA